MHCARTLLLSIVSVWAPSVAATQDSTGPDPIPPGATRPGDADERLAPELRAVLGRVDPEVRPAEGDLEAERSAAAAELAQAEVAELFKALGQRLVDGETERPAWIGEGFRTTGFAPAARERRSGRGLAFEEMAAGPEQELSPVDFETAMARWSEGWAGSPERFAFKVVSASRSGNEFDATFVVEVLIRGAGSERRQENLRWRTSWDLGSGAVPRLNTLRCEDFASLTLSRRPFEEVPIEEWFESDASVADGQAWGRPWWSLGIDGLRERLDVRLGLPLLGAPAGVALGDVNGDGFEDLYLCQPGGQPNRLILHGGIGSGGAGRDASAGSGVDLLDFSRSALILDWDGDARRDLVVAVGDELVFFANVAPDELLGSGAVRFEERFSFRAPNTTSLAAADYDGDGDLDLYACAYVNPYEGAAWPLPYHDATNGQPNVLLQNQLVDGEAWSFVDVTLAVGLDSGNDRFSFAASFEDYDNDGDPDLYVANDFGRNNLYRNDSATFVDVALSAGVEDVAAGMGVSWGDYDADGDFDLYVSNMESAAGQRVTALPGFRTGEEAGLLAALRRHARGNSLFENRGDGGFEDVSERAGVTHGRWAWGARFVDWNGDGLLDLLSPNGFLTAERTQDL